MVTAALVWPGFAVDEEEVHGLMDHAGISDRDIMAPDRFGPDDEAVAHSFVQSLKDDPSFCDEVFGFIGERIHLLRRLPPGTGGP